MDMEASIKSVTDGHVKGLLKAQESYGDSWKRRGGVGAFMMLARKWDRLENRVQQDVIGRGNRPAPQWDVFAHIEADERSEGIIDDIRDLCRYLILVEAEMLRRGSAAAKSLARDNA